MEREKVTELVQKFVCAELLGDELAKIRGDESLIASGLIDSFSLARIGVFVEEQFKIYIPDKDLTVDQMDTIDQIVARILEG